MPAEPKKIEGEKGNEPPIVVLLVDRPFAAELPAEDKPKRAHGGNSQSGASETALALRGYGLRLRENGIQSALIISRGPKDESAPQKRFVAALYERRMLCLGLQAFGGRRPPLQRTSTQLRKSDKLRSVHNRLGRLERIYVRAPIYFLTACTAQRRPLLAKQDVHEAFIRFAKQGPAHGVWIGAYVLMPDHLHAFVAVDAERVNLSALMKSLKNVLSKKLRERGVAPPHWQKGFFDHLLRSQESAGEKWKYVRENPVRAGLVAHSNEWTYLGEIFVLDYRVERL